MTRRYHYIQADVFTARAFGGNQLAVFTDARGLSTYEMQSLAREMSFSESTFVFPPVEAGASTRVRIFTTTRELPVAGHPTVGTAYVLAQRGDLPLEGERTEAILQMGIGPVRVIIEAQEEQPTFVWMTQRKAEFGAISEDRVQAAAALGLDLEDVREDRPIQTVTTGLPWLYVPLATRGAAARCRPAPEELQSLCGAMKAEGVYAFTTEVSSPGAAFHARSFPSPALGGAEDAATGSAAAPFGAYVARYELLPRSLEMRFVVEQGVEMRRPSEIHVKVRASGDTIASVAIGGRTIIVGEGAIHWE
jgi:trans-2,3-dihydro-3-hydroxyanthranilate isomerase